MCAVAHHAAAVAAPPRVVQKAEDVGLKDAPLRSLYPDEPGKPVPVCASSRHKACCDSRAAADASCALCEAASRTADSTLLKHPDPCMPMAPECSRSWSCKHHNYLQPRRGLPRKVCRAAAPGNSGTSLLCRACLKLRVAFVGDGLADPFVSPIRPRFLPDEVICCLLGCPEAEGCNCGRRPGGPVHRSRAAGPGEAVLVNPATCSFFFACHFVNLRNSHVILVSFSCRSPSAQTETKT